MTYLPASPELLARVDDLLAKPQGIRVGIVGLGVAGKAMALYLKKQGASVVGSDQRPDWQDDDFCGAMGDCFELVLGPLDADLFEKVDMVVVGPGVDPRQSILQDLHKSGKPVIGELELLGPLPSSVCAVTGTNGKSTTTAMIGAIVQSTDATVFIGGNLGTPISTWVASEEVTEFAVLELSSYQLETAYRFSPKVALVLNITPDHVDRYHKHEDYAVTKEGILKNLTSNDIAILNYDDERVCQMANSTQGAIWWFSVEGPIDNKDGIYLEGESLKGSGRFETYPGISLNHPMLFGKHNRQNTLAAFLAADALGLNSSKDWEAIASGYRAFEGLEHRLELVANENGIRYINDSKATNDNAAAVAVRAIDRPIILLAGGLGKGAGYVELIEASVNRVRHVVAFGEACNEIADSFFDNKEEIGAGVSRRTNLEDAFQEASFLALPGDVILLAPACASFDEFSSYVERGKFFKELIAKRSQGAA